MQTQVMYTETGAKFQEWALSLLAKSGKGKGTIAHRMIGRMVTAINNGTLTVGRAEDCLIAELYPTWHRK